MESNDLQLVRKVLGVVHDVDELDLHYAELKKLRDGGNFDGFTVLEYDLSRNPPVQLPQTVEPISKRVEQHLRDSSAEDSWGLIDEKWVILRLENQLFSTTGKLLLFSVDYISDVLEKLFPGANITTAEQRILHQSLAGVKLRKAAEQDNVSYETKKSQLKSVFQKTHFNNQQALSSFLITHLTLELVAKLSRRSDNAESDDMFFYYVDTYMGQYVRASIVQESANRRFRVIELGDPAGIPVVCVHHLGIINFSEEEIEAIRRNRIRLICPLRHGALGPADPKITSEQHFEHALSGIDLAISLAGDRNTVLLGLLSGCLYAVNYYERHPEKVSKLIMQGASYKPPKENNVTSIFKKNLHDLAIESEQTLELAISTMLDSVDTPEKLKKVVQESNNNGIADNRTIDELFADQNQVRALQHRLEHSPFSILQDLKMQSLKDWSPLQRISSEVEMHFIHGNEDTLIPIENIESLESQRSGVQLHTVEGAGNWIFGQYTKQTTSIIRGILDNTFS